MAQVTAAVLAKDGTVLANVHPYSLTGPMIETGDVDRLDFFGFGGQVIMTCDLSDCRTSTQAGTGDVTVTLRTTSMETEYLRIKDNCTVQQLFGLFQFTLVKYTSENGVLWNDNGY